MFTLIRDFFAEFTKLKLFFIVFCFSIIAILLSLWLGGFSATAIVFVPALLSILQITKEIWKPEGGGKSTIGLVSLGVALLAISSNQLWRPFVNALLKPLLEKYPELETLLPRESPSIAALVFLAGVILIVNYFARDTTTMKEHSTPLDKEFPEKDYKSLLRAFCGVLLDDLNKIDRETNWSAEIFTPLEAEVEIQSGSRRLKKVTDLLSAIRSDRHTRAFLILGDPGSGKSVALRKLCRDLLKEVERTGKVPLYINLREWEAKEKWTEVAPPTVEQLYDFVLNNLKSRGDVFTNEFLDKYFKKMFEYGRLFIVLDSFDEIPSVLDVSEQSWLIDKLSEVLYRFIAGAHESRGILASRIFRKPTSRFDAKTTLEIRPFTESKIVEALQKSLFFDDSIVKLLFNERQEFVPIARNPFTAALISSYAKEHNNTLPQTQAELYSSYIQRRLDVSADKIDSKNLTNQQVLRCATEIADVMFTTPSFGLEASIKELTEKLPHLPISETIDILKYARLGRLGAGDQQRFSFVHRRFNEYFVVQKLKEQPERVPQDDIPTDSRWRDALVLYCEVAGEEKARQIANFCWSEIDKVKGQKIDLNEPRFLRAVHCLRFLKEAFRARITCIDSFRHELTEYTLAQIVEGNNLLTKKLAVEAVGLLTPDDIEPVLVATLDINNQWLDEVVLKSCHYLPNLSKQLSKKLRFFIDGMGPITFLKRRRELLFSLNLSNIFQDLKNYSYWRTFDCYCLIVGVTTFCLAQPIVILPLLFYYFFFRSIKLHELGMKKYNASVTTLFNRMMLFTALMIPTFLSAAMDLINLTSKGHAIRKLYPQYLFHLSITLLFISMLLLLPWYIFLSAFRELIASLRQNLPKALLGALGYVSANVLIILAITLIPKKIGVTFGGILVGVLILFILKRLIKHGISQLKDAIRNKHLRNKAFFNRDQIASHFYEFKTSEGRLRFARLLQQTGVKPAGRWPNGNIPNVMNDEASTLLAQLEERWLGLDR
jgi:hypothetical protein